MRLQDALNYHLNTWKDNSGTRQETRKMFYERAISPSKQKVVLELKSTKLVITVISEGIELSAVSSVSARNAETADLEPAER
jgi:hypothetical protein